MIRSVDPHISFPATDPARAFRFYTETLGMAPVYSNHERGFHIFQGSEPTPTMIGVHRHHGPIAAPETQTVLVWLGVDDIASVRSRLESAGVGFLGPVQPYGPGFQCAFLDSEGNVLRLWEPIREVRRNMDIAAPPGEVFAALTDERVVGHWFASIDDVHLDPAVGGRVAFIDPLFGRVEGHVTTLEPARRVRFEFDDNWPATLDFALAPEGGGTRLDVHMEGFDPIRDRDFGIPGLIEHLDAALIALQELGKLGVTAAVLGQIAKGAVEIVAEPPRRRASDRSAETAGD